MTQPTSANFSDNVGDVRGPLWLKWLGHLKGTPVMGLELGTYKGQSAEWFLENIFTHPDSCLVCVDTFKGSEEHRLAGIDCSSLYRDTCNRLCRFGLRAHVLISTSSDYLKAMSADEKFDFVYVDAAHDAMNVLRDAVLSWEILKVGGVMIFDDYEWTAMEQEVDRPKAAIDSFLSCYARQMEVLGIGWQVAIKKTL